MDCEDPHRRRRFPELRVGSNRFVILERERNLLCTVARKRAPTVGPSDGRSARPAWLEYRTWSGFGPFRSYFGLP